MLAAAEYFIVILAPTFNYDRPVSYDNTLLVTFTAY